ncbi:MAG TPA: ABC transporter permease [Mycobacteriales bacterium]|jgi:lipooligosaccharide transport system permease protein|nr:ABC transporter permease [Mycobacteriales bacterium]
MQLRRAGLVVRRNVLVFRRARLSFWSGLLEPLIYLATFGILLDRLVGRVRTGGAEVDYLTFAGPGLLAGVVLTVVGNEAVGNLFYKIRLTRAYDALMATPISGFDVMVGEVAWTTARATVYGAPFIGVLVLLGTVRPVAAPLLLLGVSAIACGLAAVGVAAGTLLLTWQHRDLVQAVTLPLFFLSGTLFPIDLYPRPVQLLVEGTPVYVSAVLLRALAAVEWDGRILVALAYLAVLAVVGGLLAARRLETVFRS